MRLVNLFSVQDLGPISCIVDTERKSLAKKNGPYINTHIGTYIEHMYVFMCL